MCAGIVIISRLLRVIFYPLGISRLSIIPRFAEILRCSSARGSGRRFVVGHSLRATALVECEGRKAVCCGDWMPQVCGTRLLARSTSPLRRLRRHRRDTAAFAAGLRLEVCETESAARPQTRTLFCPLPRRGEEPSRHVGGTRAVPSWADS